MTNMGDVMIRVMIETNIRLLMFVTLPSTCFPIFMGVLGVSGRKAYNCDVRIKGEAAAV